VTSQFTIKFSEEHIRYAVRKFFVRYLGIGFPVMFLLLAVVLAQRMLTGQTDWIFGSLLVVLVMGVGIFVAAYFQRLSQAISQLKKMGDGTVRYEVSDDRIKASSEHGSTEVKWEMFKALWIFPRVWLLMFDKAGYLTLPADQMSEDVRNFLKQRIAAVGGKIK
jgi:hypothetical protein